MNWAVEPEECARRDRVRTKLFASILTTYGYAILAGSIWTPLVDGTLGLANIAFGALGFALHGLALYIAPRGAI